MKKKCSDVIFGCDVCATSKKCLTCNEVALKINKFRTKLKEEYLFCTNEINYHILLPDGENLTD